MIEQPNYIKNMAEKIEKEEKPVEEVFEELRSVTLPGHDEERYFLIANDLLTEEHEHLEILLFQDS